MSREVQAAVLLVIGVVLAHLALSGDHLAFVKGSLRLPLVLSAAVLLVLGVLSLVRDREDELADVPAGVGAGGYGGAYADHDSGGYGGHEPGDAHDGPGDGTGAHGGGHGHDHGRAPRIGMLMLAPILALLLVAPEPLGSYAAARGGANRVAAPSVQLAPLPPAVDGAVPLSLGDTVVRALYEPDGPLPGTPVRLVGFVADDDQVAGYRLSRFAVSCCAADASVRQVLIVGAPQQPADDTWVEVVAVFEGDVHDPDGGGGATGVPVLRAVEQRVIDPPASPYEY